MSHIGTQQCLHTYPYSEVNWLPSQSNAGDLQNQVASGKITFGQIAFSTSNPFAVASSATGSVSATITFQVVSRRHKRSYSYTSRRRRSIHRRSTNSRNTHIRPRSYRITHIQCTIQPTNNSQPIRKSSRQRKHLPVRSRHRPNRPNIPS